MPRKLRNFISGMSCKRFLLLAAAILLAEAPTGLDSAFAASQSVKVAGSTTVLPIVSRAAERFKAVHPGVAVLVNAGGSGVGLNSVAEGRVDIGLMSRHISPEEKEKFKNLSFEIYTVGHDGVACVVSSEIYQAGVKVLSKEQIRDIYLGNISNWQKVGGPDRRIVVVDKEYHRGTRHVFMKYVFGDEKARAPAARLVTGSNNEEQAKIAQSDTAIGMISHAWINEDVVGVGIRENGETLRPTIENIRSGRYPIVRDLNLITVGKPSGPVKEFIDFILGAEGQKTVAESGYIPVWRIPSRPGE